PRIDRPHVRRDRAGKVRAVNENDAGLPESLKTVAGQTSDTRLIEKAIRERWPIPEKYRAAIINRQVQIAIDPESSRRESTAAARTIFAADKLNLEQLERDDPTPQVLEHHVELNDRRSELLGIVRAICQRAGIGADSLPANGQAGHTISVDSHATPEGIP
ncbi:MAG: hypothetical protein KGL35_32230, partial [Bradyrhizobium sp.]|nr:hypothetical protein [Bradyrhizobium sp.]